MYLKELVIQGFKSFAQPVRLTFLPPKQGIYSITGIVGPNGSGKSNVSDAIRWVMGEQRVKDLRGKKHEDVIFSGSDTRAKLGMASVSMVLDNASGRVALEYDEITLTRRLYRSGESEYLINGEVVRLIDLQLLLAKAQFGQGSYAVIGQGMIDKLLLQTAEDRKQFFDEAVGIREFQMKRRQAYLKLEKTKEHVDQADLLLQEIIPRLKGLSKQVKKLEERQHIEIALREVQEQYYASLLSHHMDELTGLRDQMQGVDATYTTIRDRLTAVQYELASLAQAASRQEVFEALQKEYQSLARHIHDAERQKAMIEGSLQSEYARTGNHNLAWLEKKIAEMTQQQGVISDEYSTLQKAYEELQRDMAKQEQKRDELLVSRTTLRGRVANIQQELMRTEREHSYHRFTGLTAVQAILDEKKRFDQGVYGAVAQLGRVSPQYQLAMDVAAGAHVSSLVVRDDTIAERCIDYLRSHQLGFATFLPLTHIKPRIVSHDVYAHMSTEGVHGLAVSLVEYDARFSDIFSYVFGSTLIVDSIQVARRIGIGKIRMVTLEGDVLEIGGSMKGGYRKKQGSQGLSFSHTEHLVSQNADEVSRVLAELEQSLREVEAQYDAQVALVATQVSEVQVLAHKVASIREQQSLGDKELAALKHELSLSTMSDAEYSDVLKDMSLEKEQVDASLVALRQSLDAVQTQMAQFNAEEEQKKKRVFALQDVMQQEQLALTKISDEKNQLAISVAKHETKRDDVIQELYQTLQLSVDALFAKQIERVPVTMLDTLLDTIQKYSYKLTLIGGIDEDTLRDFEETKQRHDDLSLQLTDLKQAMRDLYALIDELDTVMKKKRRKGFAAIRTEFQRYFSLLFEGGKADLVEIYGYESDTPEPDTQDEVSVSEAPSQDAVSSDKGTKILQGIDVVACPPGKKISNLASLSGGERTMTSIALICAILKVNPSPFVVLDEVEAALDEANTVRFTSILRELAQSSQFILITHNRVTMHATDALYGVTMGNDAVSQLVSVQIDRI